MSGIKNKSGRKKGYKHSLITKTKMSISAKGKTKSLKHRKNLSLSLQGEKSHTWKGGITPINEKIRKSYEYRLWRQSVLLRDNYTCIWCGAKSCKGKKVVLNVDHIKPFAYYPELRFAIDNGRTLCKKCHKTTETYGVKKKN